MSAYRRAAIVVLPMALVGALFLLGEDAVTRNAIVPSPADQTADTPGGGAEWHPRQAQRDAARGGVIRGLARGELPASLRDTEVDGALRVDEDGRFVPSQDAIELFDYFLAASGEEPLAVLRQRIIDEIQRRLPPESAEEAITLLDRYLEMRAELRTLIAEGGAPTGFDLERRLQWLREIRRKYFGDDAAALFGEREQVLLVDIERQRIRNDPTLSPEERGDAMAAADQALPDSVRAARERARAPANTWRGADELRASGASEAEIFALREERFGPAAAERLAVLDGEQQRWRTRLAAYRAERDALLESYASSRADSEELVARLESLRAAHFEPDERGRVRSLDGRVDLH